MKTASAFQLAGPHRLRSRLASRRHDFADVETFVLFAGHPRSGGTVVAALLDSHPDAMVSIELHALRCIKMRYGRAALLGAVAERNRAFIAAGSRWSGYDYDVPGQWQGRYRKLRVIGDKKAGGTSLHLLIRPDLLDALESTVGVPIRVVGVTRHPLDNIARMATRSKVSLDVAADRYFKMAEGMGVAAERGEVMWLPHEELAADPPGSLRRLLAHVGLDEPPGWVDACSAKVITTPSTPRHEVDWAPGLAEKVMDRAAAFPFLGRYALSE